MPGRDAIAGLVVAAASLALFGLTLGLEKNPLVPIGPGFYPRIVLGISAALGLALALHGFLQKSSRGRAAESPPPRNPLLVVLCFAAFGAYVAALPALGFRLATFLFVAGLNLVLAPPSAPRHWLRALALGAATAVAAFFVFERYLSVLLPRGAWTGF